MDHRLDQLKSKTIIRWDEQPEPVREFWHNQLESAHLPPPKVSDSELDADSRDMDTQELIGRIGSDPLLAARVLAVGNSATTRQSTKVTNTGRAILQLGMSLAQSIMASYHMEGSLLDYPSFEPRHFDHIRRWSSLSSHIAYRLAMVVGNHDSATICTAALLSRISSFVFATVKPAPDEKYWNQPNEVSRLMYEQERWGMACPILSARLVELWGAPEPLPEMIATSWEPLFVGFKHRKTKTDEVKVIIATGNVLGSAYLAGSKSTALEILNRVAYEPLKSAVIELGFFDIVIDLYSSQRMKRELKFRAI